MSKIQNLKQNKKFRKFEFRILNLFRVSGLGFRVSLLLFVVFTFLFLTFPLIVKAAVLYLEPSISEYGVGETFILNVRLNLEFGENINVVEVNLRFPPDLLEVVDLSFGNSLLTIIPQKPVIDQEQGIISFAGGIPGGYTGRIPGDPALSNLLAKIIFRVVSHPTSSDLVKIIFQEDSQVLLNDGFGTPAKLSFQDANLKVLPEKTEISRNEWQEELEKDQIPPEPFKPEIQKNPSIFEGKYFLIFSTTDKQTGIDRYEISETKNKEEANWKIGESPYLLEDQTLKSFIKVKAVDKTGHQRIEIIYPKKSWLNIILTPLVLVATFIFLLFFKKLFSKKHQLL